MKRRKKLATDYTTAGGYRKAVEFAYPTSSSASRFGFGTVGCYVVNLDRAGEPPEANGGYATRDEAMHSARSEFAALPWSPCFAHVHPADAYCQAYKFEPDAFTLKHLDAWLQSGACTIARELMEHGRAAMRAWVFNQEDDPDHSLDQGWPYVCTRAFIDVPLPTL